MKMKRFAVLSVLSLAIVSSASYANILVNFSGSMLTAKGNQCNSVEGRWVGEGTIQSVCKYKGTTTVTAAGGPGQYNLYVDLSHDSWYFWCPDPHPFNLAATCNGSTFDIATAQGTHLTGETDGHTTELSGPVVLADGTKVNVNSLKLTKQ